MNKNFNCKNLQRSVNNESENYFNEYFQKKQDFIFTAVVNKEARKYIDNQ